MVLVQLTASNVVGIHVCNRKMQFQNAAIAIIAGMVFVIAFLVGWLYFQQTRIHHSLNTLAMVLSDMAQAPPEYQSPPAPPTPTPAPEPEDDRHEVEPAPAAEVVAGPPPEDTDDLEGKSKKELHELLTKKGIPFGKTDSKTVLLQLLKAVA